MSSGSAEAAAKDTTPRMPVQATMNTARGAGASSRARIFFDSRRGT